MKTDRAINGKLDRSHVTGCHARYFMDETTMAATVGKFFLNLVFINLQCNQID